MFSANRRRSLAVVASCLVSLLAVTSPRLRAAPPVAHAMWVWGEADEQLPVWAKQRGIDTLLFEIPSARIRADSTRAVLRSADRQDIRVWALSGHPEWAAGTRAAKRWTRAVAKTKGIVGIVLDVEPYLLKEWKTNRRKAIKRYLRMLQAAKKAAGDLPLMAAVPFWFDHDGYRSRKGTLAAQVAQRVDALVVMAYRDEVGGADGIATLARGELDIVGRDGKVALIALQTATDELDKLSFYEEGARALDDAIAELRSTFGDHPGFGGVAVHHYRAYRDLRE